MFQKKKQKTFAWNRHWAACPLGNFNTEKLVFKTLTFHSVRAHPRHTICLHVHLTGVFLMPPWNKLGTWQDLCQNTCHQTSPVRFCHTLNSVDPSIFFSLSALFNQCPAALAHLQQMQHTNESSFDVPGAFVEYCYFKRTCRIHYETDDISVHIYNLPDVPEDDKTIRQSGLQLCPYSY